MKTNRFAECSKYFLVIEMAFRPAIIVLGSGFTIIPDVNIYENETENAAREGYALLMVSVIDFCQ